MNPPPDASSDLGRFRVLTECRSAGSSTGGDFFALRLRGPRRLAVVIGDACGRGEQAASLLPHVLSRVERIAACGLRPGHFLQALNRGLVSDLSSDRFVTGAVFEIDAQRGTLTVANAAHVPAVLRRASGEVKIVGRASGPPLGILPEASWFDETLPFGSGDVMVLMTDGIVEAVESNLADMPRLTRLVAQGAGDGVAVHGRLLERLTAWQGLPDADDMTLLSLELLAEPAAGGLTAHQRTH